MTEKTKSFQTEMKTYNLNGNFTTITDYANANNLTRRGVLVRVRSKNFPHEVVRVGNILLIKIN